MQEIPTGQGNRVRAEISGLHEKYCSNASDLLKFFATCFLGVCVWYLIDQVDYTKISNMTEFATSLIDTTQDALVKNSMAVLVGTVTGLVGFGTLSWLFSVANKLFAR